MKGWKSFTAGMMSMAGIGIAAYTVMNKNTKSKADKMINNVLDKVNSSNMMK